MKKLLLATALFAGLSSFAQSEKYQSYMMKNLMAIDTASKNPASLLTLSSNFERIGDAEKTQWLPYYYAALMQMNYAMSIKKPADNDIYGDKALELIAKADALSPNNSELSVLKSYAATVKMLVNPMQRYMSLSGEINKNLELAMQQDPSNPRAYYFKGINLQNTPQQFGGGCGTAMPLLKTAAEKFGSFKPANGFSPNWGEAQTKAAIAACEKK